MWRTRLLRRATRTRRERRRPPSPALSCRRSKRLREGAPLPRPCMPKARRRELRGERARRCCVARACSACRRHESPRRRSALIPLRSRPRCNRPRSARRSGLCSEAGPSRSATRGGLTARGRLRARERGRTLRTRATARAVACRRVARREDLRGRENASVGD
jgi:hypothetical protein